MLGSWTRFGRDAGLGAILLVLACSSGRAATTASVAGVVRDAEGVAQVGAMVQILTAGSAAVATAFTDIYGRYRISNLTPGRYNVRATAALHLPATRPNLRLATGMRATVNLTINMLADPAVWLPAERRQPNEPGDDWTWTLRSSADKPILRILNDGDVVLANGDEEDDPAGETTKLHAAVMGSDSGFGSGGVHSVIALDRVTSLGSDIVLQADVGLPAQGFATQSAEMPSAEVDTGYEHTGRFGEASRIVVGFASHPELNGGMQWMRMANAEKMQLGDLAELEAGGTIYAIRTNGYALTTRPFLRVTVHPGQVWAVRYRLATSKDVQEFNSLNSLAGEVPVAAVLGGKLTTERGLHQEIAITRKAGGGIFRISLYHDAMQRPAVDGIGGVGSAEMADNAIVADTTTGAFRLLSTRYSASGISITMAEPIGQGMWGSLEYANGAGLSTSADGQTLTAGVASLHPVSANATTAALEGGIACTKTKLRASYRWQPHNVVTAVNAYGAGSDQAYLSVYVRQAISMGRLLPQGFAATVDVTNLLAEGYHPFLSADGRTLYLAQAPRMLRAGLSFTF